MDISTMSTMLSQAKVKQEASISVMKMAINSFESSSQSIKSFADNNTKIMELSINPHIGGSIDIKL